MKETYENLLNELEYSKYGWHSCGDLKIVSLLMGLQMGYKKYCCFLCDWDSRANTLHYLKRAWSQRKSLKVGEKNVQHQALAEWHKILLPPLHIKLDLMKNFVKASEAKIKEGGLWVLRSASSSATICSTTYFTRKKAWDAFHLVSSNFLGNNRAENYKELIEDMLSLYHKLGCNVSLKIHMLHSHLISPRQLRHG